MYIHSFFLSFFFLSYDSSIVSSTKRVPHRGRSNASSFNFQKSVFSLRSSSSCLRLLSRLPVTYILPPIFSSIKSKGKAVPLQACSGPEGSRKLRFSDFLTTAQDYGKVVSLTHRAAFTPRKYSWYSFLLEAESTPEP
jgi:hypothetical protein